MNRKEFLLLFISLILIGCGGSSQNGSSQGNWNRDSNYSSKNSDGHFKLVQPLFLTEASSISAQHYWVKFYQIDLESTYQNFPVLVSKEGTWFDFGLNEMGLMHKSLYIGDVRVNFIPQIFRATLTLGLTFLEQTHSGEFKKHLFASPEGQKKYRVSCLLNSEERGKLNHPLIFDLNLRGLVSSSNKCFSLEPKILSDKTYLNLENQTPTLLQGTTKEVFGSHSTLEFLLNRENVTVSKINADAKTKIFNQSGLTKDLSIKNSNHVQVCGKYQTSKEALVPNWIRIFPSSSHNSMIIGKIIHYDKTARLIKIVPTCIQGFTLQRLPLIVSLQKDTRLIGHQGETMDLNHLNEKDWIYVEGSWHKDQTFHGQWIKIRN